MVCVFIHAEKHGHDFSPWDKMSKIYLRKYAGSIDESAHRHEVRRRDTQGCPHVRMLRLACLNTLAASSAVVRFASATMRRATSVPAQ